MLGNTNSYADYDSYAAGKVNVGLDNLSAAGQMIIDSQNGTISNCILKIPQNFKLELSNNVLTLKAGSVLTKTGSTYATLTTTEDRTITYSLNGTFIQFASNSTGQIIYRAKNINDVGSGSSLPADGSTYTTFFNTTDKNIYSWVDGAWVDQKFTYPICLIKVENGVASFAKDSNGNDMIFNGAGFIGHHAFVYPNVKGLFPNDVDTDGTLKSNKRSTDSLQIIELGSGKDIVLAPYSHVYIYGKNGYEEVDNYEDITASAWCNYYVKNENKTYASNGSGVLSEENSTPLINYTYNGTTVTKFDIRQPYEGAANLLTKDVKEQIGDIDTILHNINSGS